MRPSDEGQDRRHGPTTLRSERDAPASRPFPADGERRIWSEGRTRDGELIHALMSALLPFAYVEPDREYIHSDSHKDSPTTHLDETRGHNDTGGGYWLDHVDYTIHYDSGAPAKGGGQRPGPGGAHGDRNAGHLDRTDHGDSPRKWVPGSGKKTSTTIVHLDATVKVHSDSHSDLELGHLDTGPITPST